MSNNNSMSGSGKIKPFCRRCLFEDIDPDGIYKEIQDMINALPEEKRAEQKEYRRRLEICGGCESLGEGMCGKCGCFVELRAAKAASHCPHERHYW